MLAGSFNPERRENTAVYWSAPDGPPAPALPDSANGPLRLLSPGEGFAAGLLAPGPVLTADGKFIMASVRLDGDAWLQDPARVWTLPTGQSATLGEGAVAENMTWLRGNTLWGNYGDEPGGGSALHVSGGGPALPALPGAMTCPSWT